MGEKKIVGLALCGSYCSYDKVFAAAGVLAEKYELIPIMSGTAAATDSRFGMAEENMRRLAELTGHADVVTTIAAAEPLGPARPMDALLIAPCTGNTLAKLAAGIADGPVTLAAKAHLRNERPVIVAVSTNDALAGNAANLGTLLNRRGYYFVPFGQDSAFKKPRSLVADFTRLPQTVESALRGEQVQPMLYGTPVG